MSRNKTTLQAPDALEAVLATYEQPAPEPPQVDEPPTEPVRNHSTVQRLTNERNALLALLGRVHTYYMSYALPRHVSGMDAYGRERDAVREDVEAMVFGE